MPGDGVLSLGGMLDKRLRGKLQAAKLATRRTFRTAITVASLAGALGMVVDLICDAAERTVVEDERRATQAFETAYAKFRGFDADVPLRGWDR